MGDLVDHPHDAHIRALVREAVDDRLKTVLLVDPTNIESVRELNRDQEHARRQRKTCEAVGRRAILFAVSGVLAAIAGIVYAWFGGQQG